MTKQELNEYCQKCTHNVADYYCEQCKLAKMVHGGKKRIY